jgi:type VI secretion system lysozyme-like protein
MPPPIRRIPSGCRHSILDRLLGLPDGNSDARPLWSSRSQREDRIRSKVEEEARSNHRQPDMLDWIIGAVREDLRCLLSAVRPVAYEAVTPSDAIFRSLFTYGLADLSDRTPNQLRDNDLLVMAIRDAITRFEPRLANVDVRIVKGEPSELCLSVRIRANLLIDPGGIEPVDFNTSIYLGTRKVEVDGGANVGEAPEALPA